MNQDQVKGSVKETAGKVQEKAGEKLDNEKMQRKGAENEVEGKIDKTVGNVKDTLDD